MSSKIGKKKKTAHKDPNKEDLLELIKRQELENQAIKKLLAGLEKVQKDVIKKEKQK